MSTPRMFVTGITPPYLFDLLAQLALNQIHLHPKELVVALATTSVSKDESGR
jgi:hypothetical protein